MKNIYLIVGKSGSGKDTIVNNLCEQAGYKRLVSYTTRPPRNDVNDKKSHIFATVNDYKRMRKNGDIIAETYYNGNYYWATRQQADKSDLYIIDPAGVTSIKRQYFDKHIVVIYIDASEKTRKARMKQRGDKQKDIRKRIKNDEIDFNAQLLKFDERVSNDNVDLQSVVTQVNAIMCEYEAMANIRKQPIIDAKCIDCNHIGVDEHGKYCPMTRDLPDESTILEDIAKAVDGYKETDMVPISGGLLYNIARILQRQI